jgi:endonuclease G
MSNDRQTSAEQNKQTFYISNAHPQYQNHNGNLWQTLENKVNTWGNSNTFRDTLYVVKAGTIDGDKVLSPTKTGLLVPKYFYMAVLCYKGDSYKAIAFWTEHTNAKITKANPADYAISVKELEELTGIDFFCNLPDDIEKNVEENLTLSDWGLKKTGE